jgi:hypothetical protein
MKKTISILILLILIPTLCFAGALQEKQRQVIAKKNVAATGDSCTGALKLSAHFENSDTITSGTPAGCNSNADTTWALASAHLSYSTTNNQTPGSYDLFIDNSVGYNDAYADITADGSSTAGTIIFDIYVTTAIATIPIITLAADVNNKIEVLWAADARNIKLDYTGGGSGVSATSTDNYLTTGSWHTVTAKWDVNGATNRLSIQIDSNAAVVSTSTLPAFTGTPSALRIGVAAYQSLVYYVDNLKVYSSWQ